MTNNKILIVSNKDDKSTDRVIDWINHLDIKSKIVRINSDEEIVIEKVIVSTSQIEFSFKCSDFDEIHTHSDFKSVWYRRGALRNKSDLSRSATFKNPFLMAIKAYQNVEYSFLIGLLNHLIVRKTHINKYEDIFINKFIALLAALKQGFQIPYSIISKSANHLRANYSYITKSLTDNNFVFIDKGKEIVTGAHTFEISKDLLLNKLFDYSLFQEQIFKKVELRIFFLHEKIYSSAVFSQTDLQTKVDFRNYNLSKPNRVVPFKLPNNIQLAISGFMKDVNMNSGSLDIIYNLERNYVFLEVNPVGQFWQVSYPCNYQIEKQIAKILIDETI